PTASNLLDLMDSEPEVEVLDFISSFAESARLLGQRTAEMHAMLSADGESAGFAPEPFTPFYQRALYQSMRNQAAETFSLLNRLVKQQDNPSPELVAVVGLEEVVLERMRRVVGVKLHSMRTRMHG